MKKFSLAAMAMLLCASPSFASIPDNGVPVAPAAGGAPGIEVAVSQSVPIGTLHRNDRYRCQAVVDYTIYFATATSESKARGKLISYGISNNYITCRYQNRYNH